MNSLASLDTKRFEYVWNMVLDLRATSSTIDKQNIIEDYCIVDDQSSEERKLAAEFTKNILLYTYHPLWQYNVTSDNIKKKKSLCGERYDTIFDLLNALKNRDITGHDAIGAVNTFIDSYPDYEELIFCIIDKDLKTRAGDKIINKAIANHIPEFSVALADKYEPKLVDWGDGWYVSRKIDGCVDYDTMVEFEDGNKMPIGYVVNNRISGSVKSYNHKTKQVEFKPILSHMKNLHDISETQPTQWYKITLENGSIINITGNDTVYLPRLRCYRRVDELNGDEEILFDN